MSKSSRHMIAPPLAPLVLMGRDFWRPLMAFLENTLLPHQTITRRDLERWLLPDSVEGVLKHIVAVSQL